MSSLDNIVEYARKLTRAHGPVVEVNLRETGPVEVLLADGLEKGDKGGTVTYFLLTTIGGRARMRGCQG